MGRRDVEVVTVPRMGRARRSSEPVERPASLDHSIPFPPMEAELVRELPVGGEWQYEPKWDGFRGLLENASGELRLWSRNARPLLRYFPELAPLGDVLPARSAIDGEIVIVRDGVLDFDAMQTRLHPAESRVRKLSAEIPARFVAFDVLVWDGVEHWQAPLSERRATLEKVGTDLTLSPVTLDLDEALSWLDSFEAIGLDGVIAKRRDKPYAAGSREAVAKVKPEKTADCVVAGLRWKADGERRIATLLLGLYDDDGELDYVGSAVVAPARHDEVAAAVTPLLKNAPERRFSEPNRWGGGELEETAVRPELVVEVRYDKVQGRRFRHGTKLLRAAARQEPGAVHVARAPPAARGGRPDARAAPGLGRVRRLPRARGLHARRLAGHLREVRRVRRLPDSRRLLALHPAEQHLEVADDVVDPGLDVAKAGEALLHRDEREVLGLDVGELVPGHRRRDRRVRARAHRVRRGDRAVARVLVVVDEDLLAALLLPPGSRHELGSTPLDLPCEGERAAAHDRELPVRLDPHRDVDPAVARGLRPADVPISSSVSPTTAATRLPSANVVPGCGSTSIRSSSGRSTSARRDGHGWKSTTARFAAQTTCATSVTHNSSAWRPEGNVTRAASTHSGRFSGMRFW